MEIPEQYKLTCTGCGQVLDMRDPSCLGHGWIEGDDIVCYDADITYSRSKEVGSSVEWTKEKEPIHLN